MSPAARSVNAWIVPAAVVRVIDGDTLQADLDLGWGVVMRKATIRVADINCPEMNTPAGKAAAARANELVPPGSQITVVSHSRDKYGRVLATVYVGNRSLANVLVAEGHAEAYASLPAEAPPPDSLNGNRPDLPGT